MPVHLLDSTHLEGSFLLDIQAIGIDIGPTEMAGVSDMRYPTREHPTITRTVLNFNLSIQENCPFHHFLNSHTLLNADCVQRI